MREESPPWKHGVVMVCANQRGPDSTKPSCGRQRGMKLRHWLKTNARELDGPISECRVIETSCLSLCPADGVAVAVEPGHAMVVVDPDAPGEQDALLNWVQDEVEALARGEAKGGKRATIKRLLGKGR